MIVVDTNLIVAFLLETSDRALAEDVFARDRAWTAPSIWRREFRNVLAMALRRSGLPLKAAQLHCARAADLLAGRESSIEDGAVLRLAVQSGCTASDCEFVVLAELLGVPLVTFDREVLAAFPATAIHPRQFASGAFWGDRVSERLAELYGARASRGRGTRRRAVA
ncbi:MAG TPA: type II toxin-antitoxin system VapC family toxin [Planctomycetota bacterium]|nr:type II toxin-antitoxin system VapC family toxin [Planctomycetota bacterium]